MIGPGTILFIDNGKIVGEINHLWPGADRPLFYAGKWREMDHEKGFYVEGEWKKLWQLI